MPATPSHRPAGGDAGGERDGGAPVIVQSTLCHVGETVSLKTAVGAPAHVGTSMLVQFLYQSIELGARVVVVHCKLLPVDGKACGVSTLYSSQHELT